MEEIINRTWFKCEECGCVWFDDCENCFDGCPECGGDFEIYDEEIIDF